MKFEDPTRAKPYMEIMGKLFYYCGAAGQGLKAKVTQNLVGASILQSLWGGGRSVGVPLARDTVEEKIRALQKEKASLAASVVREESLAQVLDLDSLKRILS